MSGVRPAPNRATLHAVVLAAGTAALGCIAPAAAQEPPTLRGAVAEAQINEDLLGRQPLESRRSALAPLPQGGPDQEGIPTPQYRPQSTGAIADEQNAASSGESLFEEEAPDDSFADEPAPQRSRPPTTARQRAEQAREQAVRPRQSAAERQEAERREEIDATPTGTIRTDTLDSEVDLRLDPRAERAAAIEAIEREAAEESPYAPLGIRMGSFIVTPTLESGLTWTSNANYEPQAESAVLSETTLRLNAISDWSSNSATLSAFGTLRESISGAALDEKPAGVDGTLELDLGHEYRALANLGYVVSPEAASSPATVADTIERPIRQTLVGSLDLEKDVGKFSFAVTGRVESDWYGDAELSSGEVISQRDRNSTLGTVALRGGYEISPALTPFLEAEIGRRIYEFPTDISGFERSTNLLGGRAGVELDLGEKLGGEISAGWIQETFDDPRLAPISRPTVDADFAWSPMRGTIVNLTGATTVEGATTPGESGSVLYASRIGLQRQMRANLTGNIALGAAYRDYVGIEGHDLTLSAEAGLTYWLNRYAGLTGRARRERQTSTLPDRGYDANSVFLGMTLQR